MEPIPENPQVNCPQCGHQQDVHPVTVLAPGDEELHDLFEGQLNQVTCETCQTTFLLDVPIVYRDDEERFLIYYLPLDDRERRDQAEEHMARVTETVFGRNEQEQAPDCRLVHTRRRFIEKIAIHEDGLDDRIIEYIKYQLYNHPDKDVDAVRTQLFYDFTHADEHRIPFILFDRETGEPQASAHVPTSLYQELRQTFMTDAEMTEELNKLFPGTRVTVEKLLD